MPTSWRCLEDIRGGLAVAIEWQASLNGDFGAFKAGFLRAGGTATRYPCPRGCGCAHRVVHQANGRIDAACDCEEWRCDDFHLKPDDIVLWELNRARLGRAICHALGIQSREQETGLHATQQVGAFSGEALPVILTIQQDPEDLRHVIAELSLRQSTGFVLLAPSSQFIDAASREHLARAKAGFFDLESLFTLLPNGSLRAHRSAGELFSPYLSVKPDPLKESEAARLFALMRSLDDGDLAQKASLARTFRLLVLEGQSQEQAARACGCAPSLVSRRVRMIESRMGMPIAQLRFYASRFVELETHTPSSQPSPYDHESSDAEEGGDDG
jgi:hypothetical protein